MIYRFDNYEMHPCRDNGGDVSQCEDHEAQFWSVYGHFNAQAPQNHGFGGITYLADFKDKQQAVDICNELNGLLEQLGARHAGYIGTTEQL